MIMIFLGFAKFTSEFENSTYLNGPSNVNVEANLYVRSCVENYPEYDICTAAMLAEQHGKGGPRNIGVWDSDAFPIVLNSGALWTLTPEFANLIGPCPYAASLTDSLEVFQLQFQDMWPKVPHLSRYNTLSSNRQSNHWHPFYRGSNMCRH